MIYGPLAGCPPLPEEDCIPPPPPEAFTGSTCASDWNSLAGTVELGRSTSTS